MLPSRRTSGREPGPARSHPLVLAPFFAADGAPLGFVHPAEPTHDDFPNQAEALLLETLAELTVVGLEIVQARVLEHAAVVVAEAQRRQLEDLLAASAQVRGYYSLDEVLAEIARAMTTAGGFGRAAIYLLMPGRGSRGRCDLRPQPGRERPTAGEHGDAHGIRSAHATGDACEPVVPVRPPPVPDAPGAQREDEHAGPRQ